MRVGSGRYPASIRHPSAPRARPQCDSQTARRRVPRLSARLVDETDAVERVLGRSTRPLRNKFGKKRREASSLDFRLRGGGSDFSGRHAIPRHPRTTHLRHFAGRQRHIFIVPDYTGPGSIAYLLAMKMNCLSILSVIWHTVQFFNFLGQVGKPLSDKQSNGP